MATAIFCGFLLLTWATNGSAVVGSAIPVAIGAFVAIDLAWFFTIQSLCFQISKYLKSKAGQ